MADTEYSVLTVTPDQLVQELNSQDYDLAVLDLSGTQQEEGPLVDQGLVTGLAFDGTSLFGERSPRRGA
jgi:hypothetical protein